MDAEINELPGVMVYGESKEEAASRASSLASRLLLETAPAHATTGTPSEDSWKRSFAMLEAARVEIRKRLTPGRDYLQEFLDDRRAEALGE